MTKPLTNHNNVSARILKFNNMFRLLLIFGFGILGLGLSSFSDSGPFMVKNPFVCNSVEAHFFLSGNRYAPDEDFEINVVDSILAPRILMLNYSAYDSAYANKTRRMIQHRLPAAIITDFWDGSDDNLNALLSYQDVVVIPYPFAGNSELMAAYGKVLIPFIKSGATVIFTGTNKYAIMQDYGILEIDRGYFCRSQKVKSTQEEHPILAKIPNEFEHNNFAYPLEISDPSFQVVAEISGYPVVGYKSFGLGNAVYLGMEFYHDELTPSRILINSILWGFKSKKALTPSVQETTNLKILKRSEETLYAGSGRDKSNIDLRVYPNPYMSKATLDIDIEKTSNVAINMIDEYGRTAATILSPRNLVVGSYHFDLPNIPAGIYLLTCQINGKKMVKKVVKT